LGKATGASVARPVVSFKAAVRATVVARENMRHWIDIEQHLNPRIACILLSTPMPVVVGVAEGLCRTRPASAMWLFRGLMRNRDVPGFGFNTMGAA